MKQIKVSEATPIQLDWLVAKCEGEVEYLNGMVWLFVGKIVGGFSRRQFAPTTSWSQGGPIVEKELINLITTAGYPWRATMYMGGGVWIDQHGPTPLIAAMRCYCCAKLGDEIEIPQELQPCQQPKT